jgi:hypothetical protein
LNDVAVLLIAFFNTYLAIQMMTCLQQTSRRRKSARSSPRAFAEVVQANSSRRHQETSPVKMPLRGRVHLQGKPSLGE